MSRIEPAHVVSFLDSTNAGKVTRHKYVKHLGYLFRFLVKQGAMERDLSKEVKLPRLVDQAPKSMTPTDVDRLVEVILDHKKQRKDDWRVPDYSWLARIIRANVYLGLRLGEVIHQRWEHVDLDRRTLAIRNTEEFAPKRGKERVIPIPSPALEVLQEIRREGGGLPWVFTSHLGRLKLHYLSQVFLKFRRLAGLPDGISFHSTRHTYATWMAERGVPVRVIQELMGHATVTTTERYMQVRPATSRHWVDHVF